MRQSCRRCLRLFLVPVVSILVPAFARAHNLQATVTVEPFWQLRVEAWFDGGDPARQARVEAFRPDGSLAAEGRLNRHGVLIFSYQENLPLRIVVSAGAGHRAETTLSLEQLLHNRASVAVLCLAPPPSLLAGPFVAPPPASGTEADEVKPTPDRQQTQPPFRGLLIGVALLTLVALAAITWKKARG